MATPPTTRPELVIRDQVIGGHRVLVRGGSNDDHIWAEVLVDNCYRLPERLPLGSVVVDIGAHTGSFTTLALDRGASLVYACEPEPRNALLARTHLAAYGDRVQLAQLAVVRSDLPVERLSLEPYPYMPWCALWNTGGQSVFAASGPTVDTIAFDELLRLVQGRRDVPLDLVKIDAQGSEWPLLLTSRELWRVRRLVGEFQELGRPGAPPIPDAARVDGSQAFTREGLQACLEAAAFQVEIQMTPTDPTGTIGLCWAWREGDTWEDSWRDGGARDARLL